MTVSSFSVSFTDEISILLVSSANESMKLWLVCASVSDIRILDSKGASAVPMGT